MTYKNFHYLDSKAAPYIFKHTQQKLKVQLYANEKQHLHTSLLNQTQSIS